MTNLDTSAGFYIPPVSEILPDPEFIRNAGLVEQRLGEYVVELRKCQGQSSDGVLTNLAIRQHSIEKGIASILEISANSERGGSPQLRVHAMMVLAINLIDTCWVSDHWLIDVVRRLLAIGFIKNNPDGHIIAQRKYSLADDFVANGFATGVMQRLINLDARVSDDTERRNTQELNTLRAKVGRNPLSVEGLLEGQGGSLILYVPSKDVVSHDGRVQHYEGGNILVTSTNGMISLSGVCGPIAKHSGKMIGEGGASFSVEFLNGIRPEGLSGLSMRFFRWVQTALQHDEKSRGKQKKVKSPRVVTSAPQLLVGVVEETD